MNNIHSITTQSSIQNITQHSVQNTYAPTVIKPVTNSMQSDPESSIQAGSSGNSNSSSSYINISSEARERLAQEQSALGKELAQQIKTNTNI